MASVDMCHHDWPGSGCKKCAAERRAVRRAAFYAALFFLTVWVMARIGGAVS